VKVLVIYTTKFVSRAADDVSPQHSRAVPLVTVRDLDQEPVADVHVTFLDSHHRAGTWAVVVTDRDDDDNMLVLYSPFPTSAAAAGWGERNVSNSDCTWTVAPVGRPDGKGFDVTAPRIGLDSADLVGLAEIAERAEVTTSTVHNWTKRWSDFPNPVRELASGRVWLWSEVSGFLAARRDGNSAKQGVPAP
jgi:hypothetical protein